MPPLWDAFDGSVAMQFEACSGADCFGYESESFAAHVDAHLGQHLHETVWRPGLDAHVFLYARRVFRHFHAQALESHGGCDLDAAMGEDVHHAITHRSFARIDSAITSCPNGPG